ncbi:MAG: hypothetical protein ABI999_00330 [Acidobacteriota bacterium]
MGPCMVVDATPDDSGCLEVRFRESSGLDLGDVVTATIAMAPTEHFHKMYVSTPICPICGESTDDDSDRVAVGFYPKFTQLFGLGFGGWAHRKCLNMCPLIDDPTPVPW